MILHQWLGVLSIVLIGGFAIFALWQGMPVRPDPNNRPDGGLPPGGGAGG